MSVRPAIRPSASTAANMGQLQDAAEKRAQSLQQIAALDRPEAAANLPPVAASLVALRYQAWADLRRRELNLVLARQTAEWIAAQEAARTAFGKAEALRGLAKGAKRPA